ncbi:MAG: helix-turn-helix domain-containing protein, partial [Planctomycetota bacterium]
MPNLAGVLKEEISRLARKETRALTGSLVKENRQLKKTVVELKRRLASVERACRKLSTVVEAKRAEEIKVTDAEVEETRMTGKAVRSMRKKAKLSQGDFAKLVDVSPMTIFQWEHRTGALNLRGDAKAKLVALKKLSKKEILERLATLGAVPAKRGRPKKATTAA